jgi:chemosensory pili system protein ChpA (sensor histidine kinase/response regulator)
VAPNAPYFMTFLAEVRGYLADMRQQIETLASPTRAFADPADAAGTLRRVGHTIASLGATFGLPDFSVLGSAMERVFTPLAARTKPVPRSIASTLLRTAIYLELRLGAMDSAERFIPPDSGEMEEARRIASSLDAALPAASPADAATQQRDTRPDDLPDESALVREIAEMPTEVREVIEAFLHADLASEVPDHPKALASGDDHQREYITELGDDLEALRAALVEMQRSPQPWSALRRLAELAHKIKGAAYTAGLQGIGGVAELGESLLTGLRQRQVAMSAAAVSWLIAFVDALDTLGQRVLQSGSDGEGASELARLHERLAAIMTGQMAAQGDAADRSGETALVERDRSPVRVDSRRIGLLTNALSMMMRDRKPMRQIVRGMDATLDELSRAIERLTDLSQRLNAEWLAKGAQSGRAATMQDALPTLRHPPPPALAQWIEQHRAHPAAARDAASLEMEQYAEFDILIAMVDEAIVDLRGMHLALQTALNSLRRLDDRHAARMTQSQRDLLNITLAPLTELVPQMSLAAQSAAQQEGKDVKFEAQVGDCELDRESWETLREPLVQLVRNAVAHGIETPQERVAAGKREPARVMMRAAYVGDQVMIAIADNGRGINPHQVVTAALAVAPESGVHLTAEQARDLSPDEALALIFRPGVSTALELRPTAGHGIGLPNVLSAVESAGGTIRVASAIGRGTTFTISVPVSQRLTRARLVRAGAVLYAVPAAGIKQIVPRSEMRPDSAVQGFYVLRELLGLASPDAPSHALIVTSDGAPLGVWVDDVSDERELITRPAPSYLRQRGVRGAAVTAEGEMVLLLDLPQAVRATLEWRQGRHAPAITTRRPVTAPDVLIVDDSPTLREHLVATLTSAGLKVVLARDGIEAIERLRHAVPRLIILDVEMPHLNGYQLLDVLRAQPLWQQVPVLMLTSRAAPRYRSLAVDRGAVEYLVKPCPAEQLLAAVTRFMRK